MALHQFLSSGTNMLAASDFRTARINFPVSSDKIVVEVAKHIKDGAYSIVSVNASVYSLIIVCTS